MSVLACRHGLSEANNRYNQGALAFASKYAPLMKLGRQQAVHLGIDLVQMYGVSQEDPVAVSELRRSQETATKAGFKRQRIYPILNEVNLRAVLQNPQNHLVNDTLPDAAIAQAQLILENPPAERVWVTHGLVIAGLCVALGAHRDKRLIPRFCEVRELPIDL